MGHRVTIYSTPVCSSCQAVKDHLRAHAIPFDDVDLSADRERAKQVVEKTGQTTVPVVDIDGEVIVGFNRIRIDELLGIA